MSERRTIDTGGLKLAYRVFGDPDLPALVFLHGLTSSGSSWDQVVPLVAANWRIYVPDLRGHGQSEWPGTYSFELLRDDVLGFMNALELTQPALIGHSMGGVAAYLLAQDHPARVSALVLEETPPPLPQSRPLPERPSELLTFDWPVRPSIVRQVNNPDPTWWERIPEMEVPTLVVAGGSQSPFPQEQIAAMAERFPNGQLLTIDVGHGVHNARPVEFAAAVTAFLAVHG
ncbi:alpha/beta fold hydrolase [Actinopolymorpha alba]|uniref:alpha/beta fold hydrolase n=1 Tax=Actinopolymorpha alba TaxID=533267 RepID=UPI00039C5C13|nr:alpha/beta hydrolase [Actinopolymorpha alba]